jgi:hypothetical protein
MLVFLRYSAVTLFRAILDLNKLELIVTRMSYPLGTSALVLAQIPLIFDPQGKVFSNPKLFSNLIFPVVLGSILFYSLLGPKVMVYQLKEDNKEE